MPALLFDEWRAWYELEHLGDSVNFRADLRQASDDYMKVMIASEGKSEQHPDDFMIHFDDDGWEERRRERNDAQLMGALDARAKLDTGKAP